MSRRAPSDPLALFHPAVREWFAAEFDEPTEPERLGWPAIAGGESALILAPTGSGKTLTAFLWCLNRLMFTPLPEKARRCRVLYVSPLKALASDVERNLQVPLAGIAREATRRGDACAVPAISIRTGDTPAAERARFQRAPADILITTPESLYLMLTSRVREALGSIETIIVDEIHALVPTKRGAHLAISLERLAARCEKAPQRIGLSATQRPLDEVSRFLGGAVVSNHRAERGRGATGGGGGAPPQRERSRDRIAKAEQELEHEFSSRRTVHYRPVTIVDAGAKKALKLTIEVPEEKTDTQDRSASVWSSIHPRLLELIRAHRSTLIFVNSRRLAERLAGAVNELAGETLVRSHHGSIARAQRTEVEELLKAGALRALVATSSLELGIDMGAIDLVVQVEAPPSVASGLQRIGRSGHRANATSEGVIFPKFRGDLLASAAVTRAMHDGQVEATRYPRNPLDIVAQQVVAMTSMDVWTVDDLFHTITSAAPFAELGRAAFEGVLDMLSGRYPSDEFAELRPRITWDRTRSLVRAREGARRVALVNGGTIPDRGLFGVFLLGAGPGAARVGELDEEMVFETRVGETFVLGASSWRVEDITHDRVLVSPAPGEPGKMPFWKGDRAGRPLELGLAIGTLTRDLLKVSPAAAVERLTRHHDLDRPAAEQLLQYLREQKAAAGAVPDDQTIVVERVRDELGDWRVCLLSPRGGRIHAPWAMAVAAKIRALTGVDVETLWGDEGFVVRFPDVDRPPDPQLLLPDPDDVHRLVIEQLGGTALFAGKFRENAARSLLLPRHRPGMRAPLWQQRKRAADLLAVAARYGSFPVLLETYRECLRDFFDMSALKATLADLRAKKIRVATVDSERPSPFAASLLFSYVASFIYDGDAPLAERRAQALTVDQAQLRELVGDAELRGLLDPGAIAEVERQLQRLDAGYRTRSADGIHDLLLVLGDLARDEILSRSLHEHADDSIRSLEAEGRIVPIEVAGCRRYIAVEDAARFRDALQVDLPPGLPASLLVPVRDPLGDLALRFVRTHGPVTARDLAARYGLTDERAEEALMPLVASGRLIEGEFRPQGTTREWTHPDVLRMIRRRSRARLRREAEPVEPPVFGRFNTGWQGVVRRRQGADALLDAIDQLQGAPLPASMLEREILPARVEHFSSADLDALASAGDVRWVGVEPIGDRDGRIALYLSERLIPPRDLLRVDRPDARELAILDALESRGATFFGALHEAAGGGFPAETVSALWRLVWRGLITNDTFHALRAFTEVREARRRRLKPGEPPPVPSRRLAPPSAEGRWAVVSRGAKRTESTRWAAAFTEQLLARHGVVTREVVAVEHLPGGFSTIYPVLKAMEESGKIRRGYFVAGLGATQFAVPGAVDLLRSLRATDEEPEFVVLAATDPANPYGAVLKWTPSARQGPARTVGATVMLMNGALVAYLARGERDLLTWLPEAEPERGHAAAGIARALIERAREGEESPRGMLVETIDGAPAGAHPLAPFLLRAGFVEGALGFAPSFKAG